MEGNSYKDKFYNEVEKTHETDAEKLYALMCKEDRSFNSDDVKEIFGFNNKASRLFKALQDSDLVYVVFKENSDKINYRVVDKEKKFELRNNSQNAYVSKSKRNFIKLNKIMLDVRLDKDELRKIHRIMYNLHVIINDNIDLSTKDVFNYLAEESDKEYLLKADLMIEYVINYLENKTKE